MTRVISFSSGKGGVGKTSLVASLGTLWAKAGRNTLLVDGDWTLGKLGLTLGVRPQVTIDRVLRGEITLANAVQGVREKLSLIAAPSGLVGFEEIDEATRNQLYYELDAIMPQYDMVLLDHSSGIHWGVLQFAAASHQHVIVTTAEPTSYTDAYAIMKVLSKRFSIREFGLVVTFSESRAETEKIISRFAEVARHHLDVRLNLLDIIPWEPKMSEAIRRQQPFVERNPHHEITRQLSGIRRRLEAAPINVSHGLRFFYENSINTDGLVKHPG